MQTIKGILKSGSTSPSPSIECWVPEKNPLGIGIVILPGGGYGGLAEHEGKGYAEYFVKAGIAAFVVSYRLGPEGFRHPAMLEDSLSAMNAVRSKAEEFGINPERIGIMGSSAGGHLASHTLVAWDKYKSDVPLRPDFGILCYPVITSTGPHAHKGSMANLAGADAPLELLEELSSEKKVRTDTPPCFIWHTGEDAGVPLENSMMFASALRENGVPFELHLYPNGRHGLGLGAPFDWGAQCLRWMADLYESTQGEPTNE